MFPLRREGPFSYISDDHEKGVVANLKHDGRIEAIYFTTIGITVPKLSSLLTPGIQFLFTHIDLRNQTLNEEACKVLCEALKHLTNLEYLNLTNTGLTEKQIASIQSALHQSDKTKIKFIY